jgi:hypothetical protein
VAARRAGAVAVVLALVANGAQARSAGPTPTAAPTVSGTLAVGDRLQAGSGTWTSSTAVAYAYQWYRCDATGSHCNSLHGATAAGYTLSKRDAGKTIGLTVTATDQAGSTPAYASLVGPIASAKPLLVSTAQPQITGLPIEGKPLQVTAGAWSPAPASVTYGWQRCNANGRLCTAIPGATAAAYTVASTDVGHALLALVQATFGETKQGALSNTTTAAIGSDVSGPVHTTAPVVTGSAAARAQLTGTTGIWTGVGTIGYAYQWYRCDPAGAHCSSVHGATKTTYRLVAKDVGETIGFTVRATDSTGTAVAYASLVGPIAAAGSPLEATARPAVTGSSAPGSTLTVSEGTWSPATTIEKYTYAWQRCNANGRLCAPISGAASASYTVTAADSGHVLVAVVTATAGSASQAALGAATTPVA